MLDHLVSLDEERDMDLLLWIWLKQNLLWTINCTQNLLLIKLYKNCRCMTIFRNKKDKVKLVNSLLSECNCCWIKIIILTKLNTLRSCINYFFGPSDLLNLFYRRIESRISLICFWHSSWCHHLIQSWTLKRWLTSALI